MTETRIPSVDVSNYELAAAFRDAGCPMCAIRDLLERRMVESFVVEGHLDGDARAAFLEAGGFCPRHAWALQGESERIGSGAVIADLYGRVAENDLALLEAAHGASDRDDRTDAGARAGNRNDGPRPARRWWRRRRAAASLKRAQPCQICTGLASADRRQTSFLIALLADPAARERYAESDGLCFPHLAAAVEAPAATSGTTSGTGSGTDSTASFLLDDWRTRLTALRERLASYDHNRDHRRTEQRTQDEHDSWTDVIERYAGPDPRG